MQNFRAAVSAHLVATLTKPPHFLSANQQQWQEFLTPALTLADSGKRTRALLVAAGWQAAGNVELPVAAGTAVELYQLSALVHDDIIDAAATRRGKPAAHYAFRTIHREENLTGDPADYGNNAGLLLGDYLLSLAAAELENAESVSAAAFARGRRIFHEMTMETAYGQYLDMRAEHTSFAQDPALAIADSFQVLRHKSARYSVELPLQLGAALGGADDAFLTELGNIGRPLGEAFQLRDDELGIFGEPEVTGKPAGGDIAEGKRTVLIGLTRERVTGAELSFITAALGRELTDAELAQVRDIVHRSGAYAAHEELIAEREKAAHTQMRELGEFPILQQLMANLAARRS
ncbi:MAG: polyprenyl synthetase family protein [Trueperella sp.]|nr:polyprenyl synthetase family protein [Trueperella sp.]